MGVHTFGCSCAARRRFPLGLQHALERSGDVKKLFLPGWLYNALPYLYAVAGVLTIVVIHNGMAIFSGLALLLAAGNVWQLRYRYRLLARHRSRTQKPADPAGEISHPDHLVRLTWKTSIETGHPVLDAQHRRLFSMANEVINAAVADKEKDELLPLLEELIEQVETHFRTEESVLAELAHPLFEMHRALHRALLSKAQSLFQQYQHDQIQGGDFVSFIAYDLILNHIAKDDQRFAGEVKPRKTVWEALP